MSKTSPDFPLPPFLGNLSIVWTAKLDDKYDVYVERVAPYEGELVIMEDDKKLTSTSVTISYDAKFGPDLEDVRIWENFCINFIDNNYN